VEPTIALVGLFFLVMVAGLVYGSGKDYEARKYLNKED
jgi:hypothetical protein